MRTIRIKIPESIPSELWKKVSEHHGWCEITPLSGELEEGIFMATFADDSRLLFEDNDGLITMLLTKEQSEGWQELNYGEDIQILEEILLYYMRWKEEK